MSRMDQPVIARQFNGPDSSGNGGYVCGMIAEQVDSDGPRTSMLRTPPPLDVPLVWARDDDKVTLVLAPDSVVGEASPGTFSWPALPSPTLEQAEIGLAAYPGFEHHPFDRCFTCGTARKPGDGLRIFAGPFAESGVAAPWTPHPDFGGTDGRISQPVMWAALDCPGAWAADCNERPMVLGKMTADVFRLPVVGEPCISVGGVQRVEGRKYFTNTALYSTDGELLGRAEQIWITIDTRNFG